MRSRTSLSSVHVLLAHHKNAGLHEGLLKHRALQSSALSTLGTLIWLHTASLHQASSTTTTAHPTQLQPQRRNYNHFDHYYLFVWLCACSSPYLYQDYQTLCRRSDGLKIQNVRIICFCECLKAIVSLSERERKGASNASKAYFSVRIISTHKIIDVYLSVSCKTIQQTVICHGANLILIKN